MTREEIFQTIWMEQDRAYDLMAQYDAIPHRYSEEITLYQAEGVLIDLIAEHKDVTITELAIILNKTPSACSQLIRKLRAKGIVEQVRNQKNNREYYLTLTEFGERVYKSHVAFTEDCQEKMRKLLAKYSDEELAIAAKVQESINAAYLDDVESGQRFFPIPGFYKKQNR